ncbi:MAG: GntP family permease [Candidatus Bathyarchaeia archaeon]
MDSFIKIVGKNRSPIAMALAGYLASIPLMCCDTAFIVLSPLARSLSLGSRFSLTLFSLALAAGAFTGFKLIFPSAPLFPAIVFNADVSSVILLGVLTSIPTLAVGIFLAYRWGGLRHLPENDHIEDFEERVSRFGELPGLWASLATLMLPLILIVIRSLLGRALNEDNTIRGIFDFIGHLVIALPIGIILALMMANGKPYDQVNEWVSKGIQRAASIIVVVGAGGVFGKVLQETGIDMFLGKSILGTGIPSLLAVFLISALIKTSQGSSMVTMVTAPAIILPMLPTLNISPALATMAVSAGAMVCINVNDSFFWVTTGFAGIDVHTGYKTITSMSIIMGVVSLTVIAIASILMGV